MNAWIATVPVVVTATAVLLHRICKAENHITEHLDRQTAHLKEYIKMSSQDDVDAVVEQLGKAKGEILTEIAALQAQVDAGQPVDLSALKAAAQGLDDLNADPEPAPVEPAPEPEAPAE